MVHSRYAIGTIIHGSSTAQHNLSSRTSSIVGGRPDRTGCTRRNGNGTAKGSENLEARKQVRWKRTCVLRGSETASSRPRGLECVRPLRDDARSWRRRQQPSSSSASGRRRGAPGVCLLALVLVFSTAFALPTHSELGCTCCRTEKKLTHSSEALQVSWR